MITKHQAVCTSGATVQALIPMLTHIWDTDTIISFLLDFTPDEAITTEDMNHRDFQAGLFHAADLEDREFVWEANP